MDGGDKKRVPKSEPSSRVTVVHIPRSRHGLTCHNFVLFLGVIEVNKWLVPGFFETTLNIARRYLEDSCQEISIDASAEAGS